MRLLFALVWFLSFLAGCNRESAKTPTAKTKKAIGVSVLLQLLIFMVLFVEAVAHMLMNLGVLPFTGRNLPLLSVNSPTDLVKWTCLFGLAAYSGHGICHAR